MIANRRALDFGKLKAADLRGKNLSDSPWWNPTQESCKEALARVAQGKSLTFYFAHGEQELQLHLRPLRDEQARIQAVQFEGDLLGEALRLREMNHRFKNHLQVVASILYFQARQVNDPALERALQNCQSLVQCISLAYQKTPTVSGETRLQFGQYLQELVERMSRDSVGEREVRFDVLPLWVNLDLAVPLGLLTHELLTQTLSYAPTCIWFALQQPEVDLLTISIGSNGQGPVNPMASKLVELLTRQLRARVTFPKDISEPLIVQVPIPRKEELCPPEFS